MTVSGTSAIAPVALFGQGDVRDPLGIWGGRQAVTGDGTGGAIQSTFFVAAALRSAYVYTCYSLTAGSETTGLPAATVKARLLTNWPNVDPQAGVQAYGSVRMEPILGSDNWRAPRFTIGENLITNPQRFILLYDPRISGTNMNIIELDWSVNTDLAVYIFECYGYFWDRSVMQAPGGPRHPGSA